MGAIIDIYNILAQVATKVQSYRLKKGKERSREETETYISTLETCVSELKTKIENLESEHAETVSHLEAENVVLKTDKTNLEAKILELETPKPPQRPMRRGTPRGW